MFLRRIPNIFHRVVKKSVFFHSCYTLVKMPILSLKMLILSLHERIYINLFFCLFFFKRKVNFRFILYSKESYVPFFPGCFSSDCTFSVCLLGIILGVNLVCLRTAFLRNQPLEKV